MALATAFQLTVAMLSPIAEDARPDGSPQATAPLIVKLVLLISKKMLLTASTFILAVVVAGTAGRVIDALPLLAVLAAST